MCIRIRHFLLCFIRYIYEKIHQRLCRSIIWKKNILLSSIMHERWNYSNKKYLTDETHLVLEIIIRFLWQKKELIKGNIYIFLRAHVNCVRVDEFVRVKLTHNIFTLISTNINSSYHLRSIYKFMTYNALHSVHFLTALCQFHFLDNSSLLSLIKPCWRRVREELIA